MEISNVKESLMVSLSTTTNITCKYTAFVGVDNHSKEIVAKGFSVKKQTEKGVMMQLLEIQAFDGSWQLTDNFSKILGNTMEQLRRESPVVDIDIWATALAVAFLRKNFLEQREEWEMVEEKALKWLIIKTNDDKDVLQEASKILSLSINDFC